MLPERSTSKSTLGVSLESSTLVSAHASISSTTSGVPESVGMMTLPPAPGLVPPEPVVPAEPPVPTSTQRPFAAHCFPAPHVASNGTQSCKQLPALQYLPAGHAVSDMHPPSGSP